MRRIVIALAGVAVGVVAFAGQASATYPPPTPTSPTPTPTESSPTPIVKGKTVSHSPSSGVLGKTVTRSTGAQAGTAFTGSDLTGPASLAAVLLVLGLTLLYLGRRRAVAEDR
jgi:hypothetical protein